MGTLAFSQFIVVADISVVAVQRDARLDKACLPGRGVTTGYGTARVTSKMEKGDNFAIFGTGCVGLGVI